MSDKKRPQESSVVMTEMVLPNDTNPLDNLMGGRLMHWMDIATAICAQRHSNCAVVTASVDNVSFKNPIPLGSIVTFQAKVTRAFRTSMEVHLEVFAERIPDIPRFKSNSAFFTFVALDGSKRPVPAPEVVPSTEHEKELFEGALRRRELRLVLAGKMKPQDSSALKALFGENN